MTKIRIIFQGGGARLVTLLAAAKAIQLECEDAQVEIADIAGVSAGSIAAGALASPISIDEVRTRIISDADDFLKITKNRLGDNYTNPLIERDLISKIIRIIFYPITFILKLLGWIKRLLVGTLKLLFGKPIIGEHIPRRYLESIFKINSEVPTFRTLEKLGASLHIFSSLLDKGDHYCYSVNSEPDTKITHAMTKSSSLPGVFSGFKVKNSEVDGGICGNLPVSDFIDLNSDSALLAFSFEPEVLTDVNKSFLSFLRSLLGASMQASVFDAREQVLAVGGHVCDLPNYVGTFEFTKGIRKELSKDRFDRRVNEIRELVAPIIDEIDDARSYELISSTKYARTQVSDIFDDLLSQYPIKLTKAIRIAVDGRVRRKEGSRRMDDKCYVSFIESVHSSIKVFQLGLPFNVRKMRSLYIKISTANRPDIKARHYVCESGVGGVASSRLIVFLKEEILKEEGPVKVILRLADNCLNPYRERRWDFMTSFTSFHDNVPELTCLTVVRSESELEVYPVPQCKPDYLPILQKEIRNYESRLEQWNTGSMLNQDDAIKNLKEFYPFIADLEEPYRIVGWNTPNLKSGESTGFLFIGKT